MNIIEKEDNDDSNNKILYQLITKKQIANKKYRLNQKIKEQNKIEDIVCDICMTNCLCKTLKCKVCKKYMSCIDCFTKFKNYELQLNPLITDYIVNCMYKYSISCPHCRTKNNIPIQNFTKDDLLKLTYKIFVDEKINLMIQYEEPYYNMR